MSDLNVCYICYKEFTLRKNLFAHLKNVHKEPIRNGSVMCPKDDCSFSCNFLAELRSHVQEEHLVAVVKETNVFNSWEDFHKWKVEEEMASRSSFIKQRGAKHLKNGTEKITFVCHRCGKFRSKTQGKRLRKSQGSNKLGGYCTAAIELIQAKNGTYTAVYFKTHFGHEQHIGFLRLTRCEREEIADNIARGVPMEKILDDIRDSVHNEALKRIHLTTRQDLYNIKRDFGIHDNQHHSSDDVVSEKYLFHSAAVVKQTETTATGEKSAILSPFQKENDDREITPQLEKSWQY